MAESIGDAGRKILRIADQFANPAALRRVGKAGADDHTGAIKKAIGDTSMSHFSRKSPVDLTVKSWVISDHEIVFGPQRKAIGPSSVLNSGHKAYTKGDYRLTGKVSKKTGKPLRRKVKRTTAGHGGKGTADEGNRLIAKNTPRRLHEEFAKELRRGYRG